MSLIPGFNFQPFSSQVSMKSFDILREVFVNLYGPKGRLIITLNLSNTDEASLPSSFSNELVQLFRKQSVSDPFISLLIGSVQNHNNLYGDGGKYLCLLVCTALRKFGNICLRRYTALKLFDHMTNFVMDYICQPDSLVTETVNFDNLHKLLSITKTVIASKPGCNLRPEDSDHLSLLVLKGFLNALPVASAHDTFQPQPMGAVHFSTIEGHDIKSSIVTDGVLLSCHHRPVELIKNIIGSIECQKQPYKVLLFDICLDGSMQLLGDNFKIDYGLCLDEIVCQELLSFGQKIVQLISGPTIVLCQKIVHPILVQFLMKNCVFVLDRLGTETAEIMKYLTGAKPVSVLDVPSGTTLSNHLGAVAQIEIKVILGTELLHLHNPHSSVQTVLLSNLTDQSLQETKLACKQALKTLQSLAVSKRCILGGGCAETLLAAEIRTWVLKKVDDLTRSLKCCKEELMTFSELFCSVLEEMATYPSRGSKIALLRDNTFGHLWEENLSSENCMCGLVRRDNSQINQFTYLTLGNFCNFVQVTKPSRDSKCNKLVLDEYSCRFNAWQVALETTSLLLHTGLYIEKL